MTTKKQQTLKQRFKVGEEITQVHTSSCRASTWTIAKVGRRYLYCINPNHNPSYPWQAEPRKVEPDKAGCFILRGHHDELQGELIAMREANRKAWKEYEFEQNKAVWAFRQSWRDANPEPDNPLIARYQELRTDAV